ncbi:DUF805 domain-containing protein [Budviciaceae bacterium BWR-B9]|uniref:DUF805 domain-containing protein n=1 Tax=Limnobaculum allomyrinae TaxID=2791986 RepID=A0ABS1IR74_9GAMM|nr:MULTISPECIES: DUF805 domain-containing protein [Limnobaculum]MBK5144251.1 DUF805 domain-containing protein [Limnobaculum allomyrinae]MBV7692004.1 DUF805 domain-containing protein [Limnobaculum sp. M2-1]
MKGTILDFSVQTSIGIISGNDDQRYTFQGKDWREQSTPKRGDAVDFGVAEGNVAEDIFLVLVPVKKSNLATINNIKALGSESEHIAILEKERNYNIIDWFMKCLNNCTNFSARARRKEYWMFGLMVLGPAVIAFFIDMIMFYGEMRVLWLVIILGAIPGIALNVRRLHDINLPGWLAILLFIPLIGGIVGIVIGCIDTKPEPNQWGYPTK